MTGLMWTHPKHRRLAAIATLLNFISLALCSEALLVNKWFSRKNLGGSEAYSILKMDVDCSNDICVKSTKSQIADWQRVALDLILMSFVNNVVTIVFMLLIFWPLAVIKGRVINHVIIVCRCLSFIGGFCKYIAVFIYFFHCYAITQSYVTYANPGVLKLETLPLATALVSFIFEIVNFTLMIAATDQGPRTGGPTHRQRLQVEEEQNIRENIEIMSGGRKVSYQPVTKNSHMIVLSLVEISKKQRADNMESSV